MFRITDAAMTMLDEIDRPEGRVVRLILTHRGGLALVLSKPRQDDVVVEKAGHGPVHIQPAVTDIVGNAVLDKVESPGGPGLSVKRG